MTFEILYKLIQDESEMFIPTLGKRKKIKLYTNQNQQIVIETESHKEYPFDEEHWNYVFMRYTYLNVKDSYHKWSTSYYNQPKFEALNMMTDPYIAAIIRHYEED